MQNLFGKEIHKLLNIDPEDVRYFIYQNAVKYSQGKEMPGIKLSKTSKMPGYSFSLPAVITCGNAPKTQEKCSYCYACQGRYTFNNVLDSRFKNLAAIYEDPILTGWTLGKAIARVYYEEPYFRFFDSGDIGNDKIAKTVTIACGVALHEVPDVRIWIPTSQHKRIDILPWLKLLNHIGAVVRPSADGFYEKEKSVPVVPGLSAGSSITTEPDKVKNLFVCPSKYQNNSCGDCRHCWDCPDEPVLYIFHGHKVNFNKFKSKLKDKKKEVLLARR